MEQVQFNNRITALLGVKYPIVQAGMVWCSGWRLASAVSNAGALGIIGAGSMRPAVLLEHIEKCKKATQNPFAVNVPLLYPDIEKLMQVVVQQGVQIVFTSAGNPDTWTTWLKERGVKVVHVVSSLKFALKAQQAGADAVVGEGFEAGGHNGREETTTFCLIPMLKEKLDIPIIAAGGVYSGRSMLAAFALGAEGVQIGTRFAASVESSAHDHFKQKIWEVEEGQTELVLKKLNPVRMLKNPFYEKVKELETIGASVETLKNLLGKGRSKRGIFQGDLQEGELEIGQIAAMVRKSETAAEIVNQIVEEYIRMKNSL
ncbi:MAG TPA: nitronate monooxygenase [Cytophagales bacterium]|nr:nitronate monooxygenase [Cytophagales bacterium]